MSNPDPDARPDHVLAPGRPDQKTADIAMLQAPLFPRLDGLMDLAKREGIDVRPTLLRVLTDLYVQTPGHTEAESRQFTELFSRLIGSVDDATVAAVRARLSVYPATPPAVAKQFGMLPSHATATPKPYQRPEPVTVSVAPPLAPETTDEPIILSNETTSLAPNTDDTASQNDVEINTQTPEPVSPQRRRNLDAIAIVDHFFNADTAGRDAILTNLEFSAFSPVAPPEVRRAARAHDALERAALSHNASAFTMELAHALALPVSIAQRIVKDGGGEALMVAAKTLNMPLETFQRVLLFLDPAIGTSVHEVYRRSHMYVGTSMRSALIMLSIWRMAAPSPQSKYRPTLYDDQRQRARSAMPAFGKRSEQKPETTQRPRALPSK